MAKYPDAKILTDDYLMEDEEPVDGESSSVYCTAKLGSNPAGKYISERHAKCMHELEKLVGSKKLGNGKIIQNAANWTLGSIPETILIAIGVAMARVSEYNTAQPREAQGDVELSILSEQPSLLLSCV